MVEGQKGEREYNGGGVIPWDCLGQEAGKDN